MLIDVSHVIEHGMITYKGLPAPLICDFLSREQSRSHYAKETEFQISKIEMVANTGTYLDAPFHRYSHGKDISELPLVRVANLGAVTIRVDRSNGRAANREIPSQSESREVNLVFTKSADIPTFAAAARFAPHGRLHVAHTRPTPRASF
jgi:kynurenine formamidase